MIKPFLCLIAVLAFPLVSCTSTANKVFLDRNGDLIDYAGDSSYVGVGDTRGVDGLVKAFENGESCLFLFASDTCSHCHDFLADYVAFAKDTMTDITTFYRTDATAGIYATACQTLNDYFKTDVFENTPTIYLGQKGSFSNVVWGAQTENYVKNAVGALATFSNIYRFGTASAYAKALSKEAALSFYYSSSDATATTFYEQILYPLAKASKKKLYLVDDDRLTNADREAICADFSLSNSAYSPVVSWNGTKVNANDEGATSLVQNYYK